MEDILGKLNNLLIELKQSEPYFDMGALINVKSKLGLYISKFFPRNPTYAEELESIKTNVDEEQPRYEAHSRLKSLTTTLIEDIELSDGNHISFANDERKKIIEEFRNEAESEREKMSADVLAIEKMKTELQQEMSRLLIESEKFESFKAKLEVADKELDFHNHALANKRSAVLWGIASSLLIFALLILLWSSLNFSDVFIKIANQVTTSISESGDGSIISNTVYFSFFKYIFTKLLLYSMLIYAIVFCIKNYNAQMHNRVINTHKANAFKSTLSLINAAKSDEGTDKLLLQATHAIFSHQQTGYNGKESEPSNPNLVTTIIDAASKKI